MNDVKNFDEYFKYVEAKEYKRKNAFGIGDFYVFENIKIIISIDEFKDSLNFESYGEFSSFLQSSETFDSENYRKTISFTNRKLKSIGKKILKQGFWVGFEFTGDLMDV